MRKESRLTTIRHGGPCGLRIEMRSAERRVNPVLFYATGDRWYHATASEGGVWHDFSLRSTTAAFVHLPHLSLREGLAQTPFPLALHRVGSVLAVKGSLRRFAPWTAPGRSERRAAYEGKGGAGQCRRLRRVPGFECALTSLSTSSRRRLARLDPSSLPQCSPATR